MSEAIEAAEDSFEYAGYGQPDFEQGINQDDDWTIQLTKGCRNLEAARTLRSQDGFNGAVIELCFGAIERTFEGYLLWATDDSLEDYMDHEAVYERIVAVGLFESETAESLQELYGANRTAHYYGGRVPTTKKEESMYELAEKIHEYTTDQMRGNSVCIC
ncbi:DNA-binding protein (plasmid) [Haloarcula sp. JP-L23]|nr:DNA-binding protein [Haloarcula sp. JP-L23]